MAASAMGCLEDARGVELCELEESPVLGVSFVMRSREEPSSMSVGITMFSGLLERVLSSMELLAECLLRLSARRCMIVLSCLTAFWRLRLLALEDDGLGSCAVPCCSAASVSIFSAGERPLAVGSAVAS